MRAIATSKRHFDSSFALVYGTGVAWRDEYFELPLLQSAGQRWWDAAASKWGYDVRN
ncbi:hypothetical protein LC612_25765 [Nostoc sp. CHAB 5834]|nr:hypothetical protein [Nostoc sp. CHAB 5834]